jgi:hypothetical protein
MGQAASIDGDLPLPKTREEALAAGYTNKQIESHLRAREEAELEELHASVNADAERVRALSLRARAARACDLLGRLTFIGTLEPADSDARLEIVYDFDPARCPLPESPESASAARARIGWPPDDAAPCCAGRCSIPAWDFAADVAVSVDAVGDRDDALLETPSVRLLIFSPEAPEMGTTVCGFDMDARLVAGGSGEDGWRIGKAPVVRLRGLSRAEAAERACASQKTAGATMESKRALSRAPSAAGPRASAAGGPKRAEADAAGVVEPGSPLASWRRRPGEDAGAAAADAVDPDLRPPGGACELRPPDATAASSVERRVGAAPASPEATAAAAATAAAEAAAAAAGLPTSAAMRVWRGTMVHAMFGDVPVRIDVKDRGAQPSEALPAEAATQRALFWASHSGADPDAGPKTAAVVAWFAASRSVPDFRVEGEAVVVLLERDAPREGQGRVSSVRADDGASGECEAPVGACPDVDAAHRILVVPLQRSRAVGVMVGKLVVDDGGTRRVDGCFRASRWSDFDAGRAERGFTLALDGGV